MFPVTVTYVSTGAVRASVTVLIRPVVDGPVHQARVTHFRSSTPLLQVTLHRGGLPGAA